MQLSGFWDNKTIFSVANKMLIPKHQLALDSFSRMKYVYPCFGVLDKIKEIPPRDKRIAEVSLPQRLTWINVRPDTRYVKKFLNSRLCKSQYQLNLFMGEVVLHLRRHWRFAGTSMRVNGKEMTDEPFFLASLQVVLQNKAHVRNILWGYIVVCISKNIKLKLVY